MKIFNPFIPAWRVIKDSSAVIARALGLQVIVTISRSLRGLAVGKGYDEPTKFAIRKSRTIALLRALIHVVPIAIALWEISINWNTYYTGTTIRNLAYYQFAAKIHEMTAQASLATIVFSYIRYEMSLGQGLPFGALFSGLQISQASYLWSMEFWGSIFSKHLPVKRRICMTLIIAVTIILAATVGPSSAILLIPRLQYWPAGATNIWLNTTSQDLWPDRTNGSLVSTDCRMSNPLLIENDCPSSGWQAVETYLSFTNDLLPLSFQLEYATTPAPWAIQVTGAHSLRQLHITLQTDFMYGPGWDESVIIATAQQSAVADALSTTGQIWNTARSNMTASGHGSVLDQLDAIHNIDSGYYQPYTAASCEHDTFYGHEDQSPLAFPPPPGSLPQMLDQKKFNDSMLSTHAFLYSGLTRSQVLETPGSPDNYRLRWIELPEDPFNGTAIGAVVLLPRSSENTTQEVLMCNLGAGWGLTKLNTSTFDGGSQTVFSQVDLSPINALGKTYSVSATGPATETFVAGSLGYFILPFFPGKLVAVTEDWANYLNPSLSGSNTTIFHRLMSSPLLRPDISITARFVLASLLANGLSRIGSTTQLQGTLKTVVQPDGSTGLDSNFWFLGKGDMFIVDPVESKNWVSLRVYSTFEGYAYNTRGAIPKVAIGLLLAYCVLALAHILYAGITGTSSTCWDSIGEVTALAVNSTPSTLLRNTCAGITELNIFKTPVRVLAFRDNENSDGEHLELVFGDLDEKSIQNQIIKENRVYGTLPALKMKRRNTM